MKQPAQLSGLFHLLVYLNADELFKAHYSPVLSYS